MALSAEQAAALGLPEIEGAAPAAKKSGTLSPDEAKALGLPDIEGHEGRGTAEVALRGAGKGLSFGFEPQIAGTGSALVEAAKHPLDTIKDMFRPGTVNDVDAKVREFAAGGRDPREVEAFRQKLIAQNAEQAAPGYVPPMAREEAAFKRTRDSEASANDAAEQSNPALFGATELAGNIATGAVLPGGPVLHGALYGLGHSKADLTTGDPAELGRAAVDTAVGAGAGALAGAGSKLLGKAGTAIVEKFGGAKASPELIKTLAGKFLQNAKGAALPMLGAIGGGLMGAEDGSGRLEHAAEGLALTHLATSPEAYALAAKLATPVVQKVLPAVGRAVAPAISDAVNSVMPKTAPPEDKIKAVAQSNPAALGKYGPILRDALANGGDKEFAARSFVLGQTDPDFQQLQAKIAKGE